jgi:hypothetical protein
MSDCLHCDINELVSKHVEHNDDVALIASKIVESLVDLILSVEPAADQAKLMADSLAHFGEMFLEKSGGVEAGPHGTH